MSKEVEDPQKERPPSIPLTGGGVSGEEVEDPLSPPAGGGVSGEGMRATSSPFYRYQTFGNPLVAAQQGLRFHLFQPYK